MLEDYRKYLLGIRNNLIQCGIEFPVSSIDSYRDLFYTGYYLDDLIWYYSVLEISGSEDRLSGFYLPLGNYFNNKMRQVFYQEFMEFLVDYNKISVRQVSKLFNNSKLIEEESSNTEDNVVKLKESGIVYTEAGRYVEDYIVEDSNTKENNVLYIEHGVYVEDYIVWEVQENINFVQNGRYVEDYKSDSSIIFVQNGIYVEDYQERGNVEKLDSSNYENDLLEEEETELEDDLIEEDEESDFIEYEDDLVEEESDFIEYENDLVEEEEQEESSDFEDDLVEGEEESDLIEEDEESDFIEYEDDLIEEYEDDLIEEDEESDFIEYEDDLIEEEETVKDKNITVNKNSIQSTQKVASTLKKQSRDVDDVIQDVVNGVLTSVKRGAIKLVKKLEN